MIAAINVQVQVEVVSLYSSYNYSQCLYTLSIHVLIEIMSQREIMLV